MESIIKRFVCYTQRDPEITEDLLLAYKRLQPLNIDTFVDILDNDSYNELIFLNNVDENRAL